MGVVCPGAGRRGCRARGNNGQAGAAADGEAGAPVPSRAQRGRFPGRRADVCTGVRAGAPFAGAGPGAAPSGREGGGQCQGRAPLISRAAGRHPCAAHRAIRPRGSSRLWASCPSTGPACHQDASPPLPGAGLSHRTCRGGWAGGCHAQACGGTGLQGGRQSLPSLGGLAHWKLPEKTLTRPISGAPPPTRVDLTGVWVEAHGAASRPTRTIRDGPPCGGWWGTRRESEHLPRFRKEASQGQTRPGPGTATARTRDPLDLVLPRGLGPTSCSLQPSPLPG